MRYLSDICVFSYALYVKMRREIISQSLALVELAREICETVGDHPQKRMIINALDSLVHGVMAYTVVVVSEDMRTIVIITTWPESDVARVLVESWHDFDPSRVSGVLRQLQRQDSEKIIFGAVAQSHRFSALEEKSGAYWVPPANRAEVDNYQLQLFALVPDQRQIEGAGMSIFVRRLPFSIGMNRDGEDRLYEKADRLIAFQGVMTSDIVLTGDPRSRLLRLSINSCAPFEAKRAVDALKEHFAGAEIHNASFWRHMYDPNA